MRVIRRGYWGGTNTYAYVAGQVFAHSDWLGFCPNPNYDPCVPPGASGPGPVFSLGFGEGIGVGISVTGAGDIYLDVFGGVPGGAFSAVYANSMSTYAGGWSVQGGYYPGGGGANWDAVAIGFSTTTGGIGYGFNFSHGLCELLNTWNSDYMNAIMEQADAPYGYQ